MSSRLDQTRSTLDILNSYTLPPHYYTTNDDDSNTVSTTSHKLIESYTLARETFLQNRIDELFLEHVAKTFDGTANTFQFPPPPPPFSEEKEEVAKKLDGTVRDVEGRVRRLRATYESFCERKEEFGKIVNEMENGRAEWTMEVDSDGETDEDEEEEEDGVADEEEKALQEEKLSQLINRRVEMEAKLRKIQSHTKVVEEQYQVKSQNIDDTTIFFQEIKDDTATKEIDSETKELKQKIEKCNEMKIWYEDVRGCYEDFGGVRSLSVENYPHPRPAATNANNHHRLLLKIELLHQFTLQVTLSTPPNTIQNEILMITDAKILNPTLLADDTVPSSVSSEIPSLDDLVTYSQNLPPKMDLQFLIRETCHRIRAFTARKEELSTLRKKYLANISSHAGDEIVCSVNEGITVVICLSDDCPFLPRSAYVSQIAGVGGWDMVVLEEIKSKVNGGKHASPLAVMDDLVGRIIDMDGGDIAGTPNMPLRKKKGVVYHAI